ncbi:MAG: hypothetical protein M1838_001869 [Thelocarpon superellum]|nr:MAG: hypothetical protein M1838_001869 [Thelocarpon superellum]
MDRPWETSRNSGVSSQRQSLPSLSDLAHGVPASGRAADSPTLRNINATRDSGNWSMQSPSKHSSVMSSSTNGNALLPSLNSSHASPNGHLSVASASSERSPFSATFPNGISSASSELPPSSLSQINRNMDLPPHLPSQSQPQPQLQTRLSGGGEYLSHEGRRSSVDSRMNQLQLASPLPSTNASQTSLVSDLQRERGIPTEPPRSNGFSRASSRAAEETITTSLGRRVGGKTAPPINANPRQWPNPNAENPTKGFPYAFPDPELATRGPTIPEEEHSTPSAPRARRDSLGASSVTSSIFTNDSRLPQGQRRLEETHAYHTTEEYGHAATFFNDRNSTEFSGANHHHHQLQNKPLEGLGDDPDSPNSQTPYSRTPELRVSHKLAERKRRSEMKGLFEDLRAKLPADGRVSKTSKWEILMKAIEYIKQLELHAKQATEMYRRENDRVFALEREMRQMREDFQRGQPAPNGPGPGPGPAAYHHAAPPPSNAGPPRPNLPILGPSPSTSGPMQGVQYNA